MSNTDFDPAEFAAAKAAVPSSDDFDPAEFERAKKTPLKTPFQMEPGLEEVQTGQQNKPQGIDPKDLGINDAGQYMNMKTGEVIPEQKETRRPSVLPITRNPAGELEPAMPKALELAGSLVTPLRGIPGALKPPLTDPFGVTLSAGEKTGDLAARNAEQAAIRGGNPHAQEWVAQRKDQIEQANKDIVQGLDPYSQTIAETPQAAGEYISQGVQSAAIAKKTAADQLYKQARAMPGELQPSVFDNLGQGIKDELFQQSPKVVVNSDNTKVADQMIGYLDSLKFPEGATGINLEGVDEIRKTLSQWKRDAFKPIGDSDTRATRAVLDTFDKRIDAAVNGGQFTGDMNAVDTWNNARSAYADYRKTFTAQSNDPVGRKVQQIIGDSINEPMDPTKVINLLGAGKETAVANRLKTILGENSPEWIAGKQGATKSLLQTGEGEALLSTGQVAQRLSKFLNSDMAGVIYSPAEQKTLRSYADLMRQITMPPGSYFPSAPGINRIVSTVANRVGAVIGALIGRAIIPSMPLVGELGGLTVGSQTEKFLERLHSVVAKQLPLVAQQIKQYQKAVASSERSSPYALSAASANLARSLQPLGIDFNKIIQSPGIVPAQQPNQQKIPGPPAQQNNGGGVNQQRKRGGAVGHKPPKATKISVNYSKGKPSAHCAICKHYENRNCTKVQGHIEPSYWCKLFAHDYKPAARRAMHGH